MILAIDPGPTKSAWCLYDPDTILAGIDENAALLQKLGFMRADTLAIEMIASYGMPVGSEIFETCVWIGRFIQAWDGAFQYVYRRDVKLHLCASPKANDANVRQALMDRFGKPGTKKAPGRTYGISKDMWSALAVGVTCFDARTPK